jgi:hypothetical protein
MALALIAAAAWFASGRAADRAGPVGLFTTLPILWNEADDVAGMLKAEDAPHWARGVLAQRGAISAIDTLAAPGGRGPLDRLGRLVIAQPRPLSPDENVALDAWVRGGGRLLLLADPALTAESAFAVGDPRRPQAVVLLSPILTRWGLDLHFDGGQPYGERMGEVMGAAVPVNLPGRFTTRGQGNCKLWGEGLAASCAIGKGRVIAVADAAVLDRDDPAGARAKALDGLLDAAFAGH